MNLVPPEQFLDWARARARGIGPDVRYGEPRCLVYAPHRAHHRFWTYPEDPAGYPRFVARLLDGLDPWSACYLWPRGRAWPGPPKAGSWPSQVQRVVFAGAGIPAGVEGAVEFARGEMPGLVATLFSQMVFPGGTHDDLFAVPDHGRQFFWLDHHGVAHVEFAEPERLQPFIDHMARGKYALPTELPDWTFRRPEWMA